MSYGLGSNPALLNEMELLLDTELGMLQGAATPAGAAGMQKVPTGLWRVDVGGEGVRLDEVRVFMAALRLFVQSSKVYRPVLDAVYRRFELVLNSHEEALRCSDEARRSLAEAKATFDELSGAAGAEHAAAQEGWRRCREELAVRVAAHAREDEEVRRRTAEIKRKEKTLTAKWVEEHEKVLVLVSHMRDAEDQHQETMLQFEKLRRDTAGSHEVMTLYQNTVDELQQMKEDFADTVPAKQFALLQRMMKEKTDLAFKVQISKEGLRKRVEAKEAEAARLEETIRQLEEDGRRLREGKGRDTPRPDWAGVLVEAEVGLTPLPGESTQDLAVRLCKALAAEQARCQRLEKEVAACKERIRFIVGETEDPEDSALGVSSRGGEAAAQYLVGLGTGRDVPRYLRWFGQVANKDLPKREVEQFLADFWAARRKDVERCEKAAEQGKKRAGHREGNGCAPESIEEYMFSYLKTKYGTQARIVDKGYNIKAACKKYGYDADCELTLLILDGHLPEAVMHEQRRMLERLQRRMEELELPGPTGKRTGKVRKAKIFGMLEKFFPSKCDKAHMRLKLALTTQFPSEEVILKDVFAEDREGNQGPFVEAVRDQMVKESMEYYQQVCNAIFLKAEENGSDERITLLQVQEAVLALDADKPQAEMDRLLRFGIGAGDHAILATTLNLTQVCPCPVSPPLAPLLRTLHARRTRLGCRAAALPGQPETRVHLSAHETIGANVRVPAFYPAHRVSYLFLNKKNLLVCIHRAT